MSSEDVDFEEVLPSRDNPSFPIEYQDWILLVISLGFPFSILFPMWLAGLPYKTARVWANYLQQHVWSFYALAWVGNFVLVVAVLQILPDWNFDDWTEWAGIGSAEVFRHLSIYCSNGLILIFFFLLYCMRERIKIVLGIEDVYIFNCKMRDCFFCWPSKIRAVEIYLYKVEELRAGSAMSSNDIFVEMKLGTNELVRTRVHKGAGSSTVLKE